MRFVLAVAGATALLSIGSVAPGLAATPGTLSVANVSPGTGEVVGVGMPVTVTFARPVVDRAAAQRSIEFTSSGTPSGSFAWLDRDVVQWTPNGLWPAHSTISVMAGDLKTSFETGSSVVSVADVDAHTFTVSIDGQVVRQMPASMGKSRFPTPIGTFTALEKQRNVTFDSRTIGIPLSDPEGYLIKGEYGVRVTWGGVYVHSAPWSVGSQGNANVSHGCINLSPENAAWYFDTVSVGDPIIVQA